MINPKYEFINDMLRIYHKSDDDFKCKTPKVERWLEKTAERDDIRGIYARRILSTWNNFKNDSANSLYNTPFLDDEVLFGILIGMAHERLDTSEL